MQTACQPSEILGTYVVGSDPDPSDEMLIQSIVTRDKCAMKVLFERHNVRVYRFVARVVREASLAENIVSEVFLDVWRQAQAFKAKSRVSTWLLAIARNKARAALRRLPPAQLDDDMAAALVDPGEDPGTTVCRSDRSTIMGKCLAQLSPAHQEIIDLVYYHEKSVKEVAQIIGTPEGTVKTRMFYARRRLGELLLEAGAFDL
jgi:RNA polymerase sigma-70 factor (ECF subfamily)